MAPWQVLRAGKATQAALGYRVHHGSGGLVHYSTAPAAPAAAPDSSSRSFCLSREKVTMQQLNRRLASYLQQVQCLEAANQKLESQIQKELDEKCPGELRQLDRHLRTVSLLQDQMSDCLSAQAQVKLQLLSAELTVFDLNLRCEKERERRNCLEAELSDLRLLEEELHVHRLPELQSLLMEQTQELTEVQKEHQQNMQGLLAHMSGGVTVEMQSAVSSDLIQQLDDLRQTSVTLLDKNQNECWLNAQVSMLNSPEVTFGPPAGSEVIQAELEEVRKRAASLEEELTHLKSMNMVLEASGREQNECFVQQLVVLQQRADSLCNDLDSVLQAAAQQAAEYQNLLDVKTRLETEIQDYMRLLDGLSPQGVSSLHPNSAANITSLCVPTSPCTFRRNITVNKTAGLQGGNFRMMEVQDVSRGHIRTVGKTPMVAPVSQTVTTVQSVRVQQSKHASRSPVTSINTSNVTGSFHKSEKQRTRAPLEKGSMTVNATINRHGSPVKDEFHTEDRDLKKSSIVSTQISQGLDRAKASKLETNTAKGSTMLVSAAVETKQGMFTPKTTTEASVQANKTVITKTIPCVEPDVKQGPNFGTHTTTTDPSKCIVTEVKKETETAISAQVNCIGGSIQGKLQDPPQVDSLNLETQAEAVKDVAITASVVTGSLILTSEEARGKASGDLTLTGVKGMERQEKNRKEEVDGILTVLRLDQRLPLSDASKDEQKKVVKDADTGSATALSDSPENNDNPESKTAPGIITLVPHTQPADVQAKPVTFTSNQTTTECSVQANKTGVCIQTVITKTIPCAEPEVQQGPVLTATDSNKQTAAEVKRETETVISAQINCTEGSIQAKNKDPARVVSSSVETQAEAVQGASVISGSNILRSEEAQDKVSGDLTLMNEKAIERQEKNEEGKGVEGTLTVLRLDHGAELPDASNSKQNKVTEDADTGSSIITATSSSTDSHVNLESKTEQEIITMVPATQSARSADVQAKPATFTSNQTTEAVVQTIKRATNIQTVITKTIPCVKPEVKQGPNFVAHMTTVDSSKQTAAKVNKKTETVISAQINHTDGSIQDKNKDPEQVVSSNLEAQTVSDAGNFAITASVVSGSNIVRAEEAQSKVSGELTLTDHIKRQEKSGETEVEGTVNALTLDKSIDLSDTSNMKQNKVTEDGNAGSVVITSSSSPDSNDSLNSKTAQGIITLGPETQSATSAAVQAKLETFISNQATAEAGMLANKTETKNQTVITKTIPCAEAEVKQRPNVVAHTTTNGPNKQTAAEVNKKTETVISAQINHTDGSIQAKNKDPEQVVSSNLEAQTVSDAGNFAITASVVSGSNIVRAEEAQSKVSGELTLTDHIKRQEKSGETEVEGTVNALTLDKSTNLSDTSNMKQNKVTEDGNAGSVVITSSSGPDSNESLNSETAQEIITLGPETQSATSAAVQAKLETFISNQAATEAGMLANKTETKNQTVITKTIPRAEAEINKNTETVISAQIKHKDPAQVVSLCPETLAEVVGDAGDNAVKASAQVKVFDLTLMDDKDTERQQKKGEEEVAYQRSSLSDASNSKQNEVVEDADTGSGIAAVSSGSPDSNDNLESKIASTESLRKVELVKKGEVVNSLHDTKEEKDEPPELDNEMVILADQEALLSTTQSKLSTRRNDSGVALSSSNSDGLLNPSEDHEFATTTDTVACLSPKICLSPVETEVLMSMTDQVFYPVDLEERVLSPSDSGTCLSPVEAKLCLSPNGDEEDEEVCLSLTEANAHVRPVEKYILSTKEEGQSLSFSRDQALPEVDRNIKVSVSTRGGESLCFGSLEGDKGSSGTVNGSGNSKPSQGISLQISSSGDVAANLGGTDASSSGNTDAAGVKGRFRHDSGEWKVYGGSLGQTNVSLPNTGSEESPSGATIPATSQQETGRFNYRGSLGRKSSLPRTKSEESPSAAMLLATSPPETKFGSRGNGVVYSSSPKWTTILAGRDSLPNTESRESLPTAMQRALSPPGTGKFGNRGSGEWRIYGGSTGRISSWAGSDNLPTADRKENQSVAAQLPVSPPGSIGAGKFGSRGSGEWRIYGGSSGRISSWAGSDNLPTADRKENQLVAAQLPISPPGSIGGGKFGSRGSGEWRVYGRSSGRISSWAGSENLPTADKEENQLVAAQLPTSPPGSIGAGRFGSGGSGEWRVYGGSSGRLSSASNTDRVSVGEHRHQVISPPSSYTSSRLRHSSGSSSGRLGSGSVVRRSSSVGSGGRLSSSGSGGRVSSPSGSNRTSTSGRFSSTASGEYNPIYSSASGRKSTVGSAGRSAGGGTIGSQRAPSPGGRMSASMGSGGWLSSSTTNGTCNSSSGSGSKLSSAGGSDRVSSRTGGRISSSSGSGRTNSTGGRVISSSDRPIRSTGSGAGSNKERISVCKMAALSMSAAGRERSEDRQRQAQRRQQQQAAGTSPLLQRWLTSGGEVKTANPDGLDDMRL